MAYLMKYTDLMFFYVSYLLLLYNSLNLLEPTCIMVIVNTLHTL